MEIQTRQLKTFREQAGISRSELARRAGMQSSTVGLIEAGRFVPYDTQLQKLAKALQVKDPESLLIPIEGA